ncbi:hypothetical protein P3T76_009555 [Phytophthora citrophthora]|uniref:MULE transposase domain-containing protein n=1 Tax=Phytophthora citrophthora TaxID=4793 RepID=A0AAD9GGS5_9STRA|nr:hypothetical protein P3T76_009555 [Phytophthora citrophthora]
MLRHAFCVRLLRCSCEACGNDIPYTRCKWRGKTQHCSVLNIMTVWEAGAHESPRRPERRIRLTEPMKAVAREMVAHNHRPTRIRNALLRRFNLNQGSLPSLAVVQRFVHHYRAAHLGGSDFWDDVSNLVRERGFTGQEDLSEGFTFTWNTDMDGHPVVGTGTDTDPFVVGLSSKKLMQRCDQVPAAHVLHVDATFKLNQVNYPVIVVGISDCMRTFHLLAVFISSQRTKVQYVEALSALKRVFRSVTGHDLAPRFVMVDADEAQLNGVEEVFSTSIEGAKPISLMCYFHVLPKVHENTRALEPLLAARVMRDIADLHFTATTGAYAEKKAKLLSGWEEDTRLSIFSAYFKKQWLDSRFHRWQIFYTRPGFATTNNPVEQYNRALKRDYTLHSRLKMGALIEQLLQCCRTESLKEKPFATEVTPSPVLVRRARELERAHKIRELVSGRSRVAFLLNDAPIALEDHVYVASELYDRVYDPLARRTNEPLPVTSRLSVQTARAEVRCMPGEGWCVDVLRRYCPCDYHLKFGVCTHLVFALHVRGLLDLSKRKKLTYRGANKALRAQSQHQLAGRPNSNSTALYRD